MASPQTRTRGHFVRIFPRWLTLLIWPALFYSRAAAQPLLLPEYPADQLQTILQSQDRADGPLFRIFLAEIVHACALSRTDLQRTQESAERLKTVAAKYPDLLQWLNGGLPHITEAAQVKDLVGDVNALQSRVDSLVCRRLVIQTTGWVESAWSEFAQLVDSSADPCAVPAARTAALGVLERVYRDLDLSQRRQLIDHAFSDSFYVDIVNTVNDRLLGNGQVSSNSIDFSQMMDIGALTAGMPEKYAELLNLHLPIYYRTFRDKHRMAIHYLMAEPHRRMAAMFHASGPVLQKLFQMIADYTNNPKVRAQLNELKSGIKVYGEQDIRETIDSVLRRSVPDSIYPRLTVDYRAVGAGTIAQAHKVTVDKGSARSRRFIIKVKRPGLIESVEREMALFEGAAETPFAKKLIKDVRATLEREMNLGREADEIREATRVYRHPRIGVARVVEFVSPSDSLVAIEFVDAPTLDKINEKLTEVDATVRAETHKANRAVADHYLANLLSSEGEALFELAKLWMQEALLGSGFFHGDLHSGNVFFSLQEGEGQFEDRFVGNSHLTIIDFGNTGRFTRSQQQGVVEFMAGVAREESEEVLDALAKIGTILDSDRAALRDTVRNILSRESTTSRLKADRIATVAYAEGGAYTRDLLSFTRGRVLLETQLLELNRRLDQVDPDAHYPRYAAPEAYRLVFRKRVIGHCIKSLFGFRAKGNRVISCDEAKALQKAAKRDQELEERIGIYRRPNGKKQQAGGPRLGFRAGVNAATVSGDAAETSSRWAWHAGLYEKIFLKHGWFLQPELTYSNQGYNRTVGALEETNRVRYILIPVLIGRQLSRSARIYLGPQIGFPVGGTTVITDAGRKQSFDIDDNIKRSEASLVLGAGLDLPIGFQIDLRYNLGLSDFSEGPGTFRNRVVQLSFAREILKLGG